MYESDGPRPKSTLRGSLYGPPGDGQVLRCDGGTKFRISNTPGLSRPAVGMLIQNGVCSRKKTCNMVKAVQGQERQPYIGTKSIFPFPVLSAYIVWAAARKQSVKKTIYVHHENHCNPTSTMTMLLALFFSSLKALLFFVLFTLMVFGLPRQSAVQAGTALQNC